MLVITGLVVSGTQCTSGHEPSIHCNRNRSISDLREVRIEVFFLAACPTTWRRPQLHWIGRHFEHGDSSYTCDTYSQTTYND